MMSLERAIVEYFKLSRPQFCQNNPFHPVVFSASAVSLASRMWLDGTDLIPATWFIALIGEPRSGKTGFYRRYFQLFSGTGIEEIPIGSPEAMLKDIKAIKHGYIYYDEVAHLAKLMDSYMGTLPTHLNKAYYLDTLSQTRTNDKNSVVIPEGSYFIHVYFGGTPGDWASIERKAPGGFVRRTLVLPTRGEIPFFRKAIRDRTLLERISLLRRHIRHILSEIRALDLTVVLPEYPDLAEALEKSFIDKEKKSMVEEYLYKLLAGRIVANLITFDVNSKPESYQLNEIVHAMLSNAKKIGVHAEVLNSTSTRVEMIVGVPEPGERESGPQDATLDEFMPPNFHWITFKSLMSTIQSKISAPDDVVLKNAERIQQWIESGGSVIVSTRQFVQKILHTTNPQVYKPLMELLVDGGYIRVVEGMYRGRVAKYVVLDTQARICANCRYFHNPKECPRLKGVVDIRAVNKLVQPWDKACDKFELADEEGSE